LGGAHVADIFVDLIFVKVRGRWRQNGQALIDDK
jgi:hypothetical protein